MNRRQEKNFSILAHPDWDRRRFSEELIAALREGYTLERQAGPHYLYQQKS